MTTDICEGEIANDWRLSMHDDEDDMIFGTNSHGQTWMKNSLRQYVTYQHIFHDAKEGIVVMSRSKIVSGKARTCTTEQNLFSLTRE